MQYLFELSTHWTSSEFYYDEAQNRFLEKRYHEEYLDTGTICDGLFPISDDELWEKVIRAANEEGVDAYLKIRGSAPAITKNIDGITIEEFKKQLVALRHANSRHCYNTLKVGSVLTIMDEKGNILGILSNTVYFWFYITRLTEKIIHGFYTQEEALKFALQKITEYHKILIAHDKIDKDKATTASLDSNTTPSPDSNTTPKKKWFFGRKK